ncbi:response regulator [Janthinobacterium sp. 64]|uniref:response regulator n=1 Tax=Janthinobacterium sp. 64 TaxID=2035208 RepID=UPI001E4E022F|nr:response regulator [Janthinobacterium sp. 64]
MPGTAVLAADAVQQPAAQRRTLLLVDDEPNILASLKRLLRRDGYHILTANSGQEGLDVLDSNAVDVIVSDQRMPGMLGADFLRKAKLQCPQTIRIMLSGYTELQAVTDAVNEGAIFKFLTKPWEDHQLREHIAEAFRLKGIDDDNVRLNAQLRDANQALAAANAAMQALVNQQQHQISRDEVSLGIAREVLQFLPLPVIGLDDEGMIAFINASAANLFERGAALLGNEAALVLPQLFDGQDTPRLAAIDGQPYVVAVHPMGLHSRSRGSLVTLSRHGADT